jgi:hypothetical protein
MRGLLIAATAIVVGLMSPLSGQTKSKTRAKSAFPRTPEGKPDLNGVWQGGSTQKGSWEEANAGLGVGGTGLNPTAQKMPSSGDRPASGAAPYQPWAAQKVLESFNRRGIDDPTAQCLPPGVPRGVTLGLFPWQIVQTPQQIVILYEYMNVFRIIPLNAKHPDDVAPTFLGNSVGHWEGDTLVVDVIGFNDKTWLQGTGTFHTEALHITERYTRVDKNQINYEATMEDPNVLTRPWTIHSTIMLREGTRIQESICAENNLDSGRLDKLEKDGVKFKRE